MCDITHSYMRHDSFICVTWLIDMGDMAHPYVWRDSCICMPWLIDMCDMTHSYVWHDMCDTTHSYEWHDSFICAPWLIHLCDMTISASMHMHHSHWKIFSKVSLQWDCCNRTRSTSTRAARISRSQLHIDFFSSVHSGASHTSYICLRMHTCICIYMYVCMYTRKYVYMYVYDFWECVPSTLAAGTRTAVLRRWCSKSASSQPIRSISSAHMDASRHISMGHVTYHYSMSHMNEYRSLELLMLWNRLCIARPLCILRGVLRCVGVCWSVSECVAVTCSVLQWVAMSCSVSQMLQCCALMSTAVLCHRYSSTASSQPIFSIGSLQAIFSDARRAHIQLPWHSYRWYDPCLLMPCVWMRR